MGEFKPLSEILKPIIEEITVQKEIDSGKPSVELTDIIDELCRDSNVAWNRLEMNGSMQWSEFKDRQTKRDELKYRAISIIGKLE